MHRSFTDDGWNDYQWSLERDRRMLGRINALIQECARTPYEGIGKPEALTGEWKGWWSRRIDGKHRLVYRVREGRLEIGQCRSHYGDR